MENPGKDINEKNKIYAAKRKGKKKRNIAIGAVLCIYTFLFASSFVLPSELSSASEVTEMGSEIEFAENRAVTLVSATYDESKELMELVMNFKNNNYDNIDDYYYAVELAGTSSRGVITNEIYNDNLITVIRVEHLPKNYDEMTFLFAPKAGELTTVTDEMTGEIILNKYNVTIGSVDLNKSKTDYLIDRMDSIIKNYEKRLERKNKQLKEVENRISALEGEIADLEKNEMYMTEEEIARKQQTILNNQDEIVEAQEELNKYKAQISQIEEDIREAEARRNAMR